MDLTIITPRGKVLDLAIEDFAPISVGKETTEIMLIMLEEKTTNMLRNTLEYNSIKTYPCTDNLGVIVDKPRKMRAKKNHLTLKYKI